MKKIFFFAVLAVAIAGYGMHTGVANAQTTGAAAPTDTSTLVQELQVAKATLLNLEMQEGMIPQSDNQLALGATAQPVAIAQSAQSTQTASGLSASEISFFSNELAALTNSLSQLNAVVAANPNMSTDQEVSVVATLGSIKDALIAMSTAIARDEQSAPVAVAAPSAGAAGNGIAANKGATATAPSQVAQTSPATPATTAAPAAAAPATATNVVQATAQASSVWSFTKTNWPVIVIIVLVIAILAILFWPEKEEIQPAKTTSTPPVKPVASPTTVSPSVTGNNGTVVKATVDMKKSA